MKQETLTQLVGNTDIYIIDQIMKERYLKNDKILDAGCGEGRNLKWFYLNGFDISGIDTDVDRLQNAKILYPKAASQFQVSNLEQLPYKDESFNHVLCSAVLHFSNDETHFYKMFSELSRVLKTGGSLFIRVASNIGLDGHKPYLKESQTNREGTFFITRAIIKSLIEKYSFELIDPIKTTNVQDIRAMTTLVMRKT
ncbi:MAG: class I SAM-dependent methyltransferase [Nonlabens sp.]|uniref:class I SAM-dependent methyltransferase n=1 Tax=Nonlabens sp. TaxID=1888209 RepID=UPI0032195239